jgi:hypothetical protein
MSLHTTPNFHLCLCLDKIESRIKERSSFPALLATNETFLQIFDVLAPTLLMLNTT